MEMLKVISTTIMLAVKGDWVTAAKKAAIHKSTITSVSKGAMLNRLCSPIPIKLPIDKEGVKIPPGKPAQ